MNLYIPELGTQLVLEQDWTFNLYSERRNEKLFNHFGYVLKLVHGCDTIPICLLNKDLDKIPIITAIYPTMPTKRNMFSRVSEKDYDTYNENIKKYYETIKEQGNSILAYHNESIIVTIPKDCILTVDRIYIRKNLSDYSSISFFVKGLGKGKIRFWAKLSDCNNINFKL